jgi:hypothetical protein
MKTSMSCAWCGHSFRARQNGGKPQRFCCAGHRSRYWGTGRKWLAQAVEAGFISLDDLRRDPSEFFRRSGGTHVREGLCPPRGEFPSQDNVPVVGAAFQSGGARGVGSVEESLPP